MGLIVGPFSNWSGKHGVNTRALDCRKCDLQLQPLKGSIWRKKGFVSSRRREGWGVERRLADEDWLINGLADGLVDLLTDQWIDRNVGKWVDGQMDR